MSTTVHQVETQLYKRLLGGRAYFISFIAQPL